MHFRLKFPLAAVLTGVAVGLTYYVFEAVVRRSIDWLWLDWLNTGSARWLVVPLCLLLSLAYFGLQHYLDPKAEEVEEDSLGGTPVASLANYGKILLIGFASLLAGASLGPEAILVPSCMIVGVLVASKLFSLDSDNGRMFAVLGFVALFAAFFDSFFAGLVSLLLISQHQTLRLSGRLVFGSVIAAAACIWALSLLETPAYFSLPSSGASIGGGALVVLLVLVAAGAGLTYGLNYLHGLGRNIKSHASERPWAVKALLAAGGLSLLYLLGGELIQFTGNESVQPMLADASTLGTIGLLWLVVTKLAAMGWSKAMGYRGGLIFPSFFVASTLVAIASLHVGGMNFIYGLVAVGIGMFWANKKLQILF